MLPPPPSCSVGYPMIQLWADKPALPLRDRVNITSNIFRPLKPPWVSSALVLTASPSMGRAEVAERDDGILREANSLCPAPLGPQHPGGEQSPDDFPDAHCGSLGSGGWSFYPTCTLPIVCSPAHPPCSRLYVFPVSLGHLSWAVSWAPGPGLDSGHRHVGVALPCPHADLQKDPSEQETTLSL